MVSLFTQNVRKHHGQPQICMAKPLIGGLLSNLKADWMRQDLAAGTTCCRPPFDWGLALLNTPRASGWLRTLRLTRCNTGITNCYITRSDIILHDWHWCACMCMNLDCSDDQVVVWRMRILCRHLDQFQRLLFNKRWIHQTAFATHRVTHGREDLQTGYSSFWRFSFPPDHQPRGGLIAHARIL